MTDRYNAFLVVLEQDLREDDAEATLTALKQIKGVLSVEPHVASFEDHIAEARVRAELVEKLWQALGLGKK